MCPSGSFLVSSRALGQRCGDRLLRGLLPESEPAQDARVVGFELEQRQQDVLGPDVVVAQPQGLPERQLERLAGRGVDPIAPPMSVQDAPDRRAWSTKWPRRSPSARSAPA